MISYKKMEEQKIMPYIDIRISKPVNITQKNKLQSEIAGIMEIIPGKNAGNTTICISDNHTIYRDTKPIEAAFVDIRLYKESSTESKGLFAERLFSIFEKELGIQPSHVSMNFVELPCWASNVKLF